MNPKYTERAWWIAIAGVPLAAVAASLTLEASWWSELPADMPSHWNASGAPDAFKGPGSTVIATLIVGLALPALMLAITAPHFVRGVRGVTYRLLAAMSSAYAVLGGVLGVGLSAIHRGVPEGGPWPSSNGVVFLALGAAVAAGLSAFFLQPRQVAARPAEIEGPGITLAPGERVTWMRSVSMPRAFIALLAVIAAALVVSAVVLAVRGQTEAFIIVTVSVVVMVLAAATATSFHVRVDAQGLTAVSASGWPRIAVPIDQVAQARAVRIEPLGEFGGYGVRYAPRAVGIIMRSGEALEVTRTNGRRVVITTDDAATAAGLLTAFARRP